MRQFVVPLLSYLSSTSPITVIPTLTRSKVRGPAELSGRVSLSQHILTYLAEHGPAKRSKIWSDLAQLKIACTRKKLKVILAQLANRKCLSTKASKSSLRFTYDLTPSYRTTFQSRLLTKQSRFQSSQPDAKALDTVSMK